MLPLLDPLSPSLIPTGEDGVLFLADTMDDEQIEETRTFLKQQDSSWNHVMAVSERAFGAVCDCLVGTDCKPWSLHLSFIGSDPEHVDDTGDSDHLSALKLVNLHSLQLDLWRENTSWSAACIHLKHNQSLKSTLTKLVLPRYTLTGHISSNLMHFMHNSASPHRQRLQALQWISIEMDDDLLPNEQQFANDLQHLYRDRHGGSNTKNQRKRNRKKSKLLSLKNPIYLNLHQYCIDRLQVLECAFDVFMSVVYGLWRDQFPKWFKERHDAASMDRVLSETMRYPLCIERLTIYPPILQREMVQFVHVLQCHNAPNLVALQFQNWDIVHLATFCKAVQRLATIRCDHGTNSLSEWNRPKNRRNGRNERKERNSKRARRRRRGQRHRNYTMSELDRIIAELDAPKSSKQNDVDNVNALESTPMFHHIHSFKVNVNNPSLLSDDRFSPQRGGHSANSAHIEVVEKLYDPMGVVPGFKCDGATERELHKKRLWPLLNLGHLLRFQFVNAFEFGLNHYQFLFGSEQFMVRLLNGIAQHPYLRSVALQGIGRKGNHAVNAQDLSLVIRCTSEVSRSNFAVIEDALSKHLSAKDVRAVVLKCLYGGEYGNGGTGILKFDVSTNKKSAHRTLRRRHDTNVIDTKLEGFERVLEALDRNWRDCGLAMSEAYWDWKNESKKISNVPKMRYFAAM